MPRFYNVARDSAGNAISSPTVTVYLAGTAVPLPIYSDAAHSVAKANPFVGNADGSYDFYVQLGPFKVEVVKAGYATQSFDEIPLPGLVQLASGSGAGVHTGTTADTKLLDLTTLPANVFSRAGQRLRLRVSGRFLGTANTKTLRVKLGGSTVGEALSANPSATRDFVLDYDIVSLGGSSQRHASILHVELEAITSSHSGGDSVDVTTDRNAEVWGQLADPADSIDLRYHCLDFMGA